VDRAATISAMLSAVAASTTSAVGSLPIRIATTPLRYESAARRPVVRNEAFPVSAFEKMKRFVEGEVVGKTFEEE
jgi:hypothetical protein